MDALVDGGGGGREQAAAEEGQAAIGVEVLLEKVLGAAGEEMEKAEVVVGNFEKVIEEEDRILGTEENVVVQKGESSVVLNSTIKTPTNTQKEAKSQRGLEM